MSDRSTTEWLASQNKFSKLTTNSVAQKISIISGKGGVGKTTVSLGLSMSLRSKGKRVLLLDCDYNLSNAIIKLGLPLGNDFYELLCGKKKFDECIRKWNGIDLLSGCNGSLDLFAAKFQLDLSIIDLITEVEASYDYIILDCPAGLDKFSLALNSYSNDRIVVVNPDRSSITDAYSIIKILNKKYGVKENYMLFNRTVNEKRYKKISAGLSGTVSNFLDCRIKDLGHIPEISQEDGNLDKLFSEGAKSSITNYFDKVMARFTDSVRVGRCDKIIPTGPVPHGGTIIEQDVQQL